MVEVTCQHAHTSLTGVVGDLILAMCDCGHHWITVDQWPTRGTYSAFERAHPHLARRVEPGMVERSEPLRIEAM